MRKTAVWNIRTWPGRSRRCLFVGNRAGRRFRPVSRHEPTMNTLNQSLPECNQMIASQACQDVCHPHDYSLVCSLRSYMARFRAALYIFQTYLLIYMNSLAASAFEIQVFVVLFPCEVAARLFIRAWFITPMQRGQIREAHFRLFSSCSVASACFDYSTTGFRQPASMRLAYLDRCHQMFSVGMSSVIVRI